MTDGRAGRAQATHNATVHLDSRKWPNRSHWHFDAQRLGEDEYGVWLFVGEDTIVQRGDEPSRPASVDVLLLVPEADPWIVEFTRDHPQYDIYVNIGTVPEWTDTSVVQIDLDLDVVRQPDGSVVILDEDEFLLHQDQFEYPDDLIALARRATDRAVELLTQGSEPFGAVSESWWLKAT